MNTQFLTPVAAGSIEMGPIPFSLHATAPGGRIELLCRAGHHITVRHKVILERSDRRFFITSEDIDEYLDYVFERIDRIVASPDIPTVDKAQIVRFVGRRITRALLAHPRSGEAVSRGDRFVESQVDLILSSPDAAGHLLALSAHESLALSHGINVCAFCIMMGEALYGPRRELLWSLGLAGLLHDIGKTQVDRRILTKLDPLTPDERRELCKHPIHSYQILKDHLLDEAVIAAALDHHERIDGRGYPRGVRGKEIHPFARIVATANIYDNLTSDSDRRSKLQPAEALARMAEDVGRLDRIALQSLAKIVLRNEKLIKYFVGDGDRALSMRIPIEVA